MTDKLLCLFCNKPLQPTLRRPDEYWCENYDCPQTNITWVGTSSLWKALADTKKKLDIAVNAIKWIDETYELGMGYEAAIREKCQYTLEQIKDNDKGEEQCLTHLEICSATD